MSDPSKPTDPPEPPADPFAKVKEDLRSVARAQMGLAPAEADSGEPLPDKPWQEMVKSKMDELRDQVARRFIADRNLPSAVFKHVTDQMLRPPTPPLDPELDQGSILREADRHRKEIDQDQKLPPGRPIRNFLKHFAGLGFFCGSLAMIGIDEYALAGLLLVLSGIAFYVQIHEWKIFPDKPTAAKGVKGLLYLSVIIGFVFFAAVFVKHKGSKRLSNLLPKYEQQETKPAPDQTKIELSPKPYILTRLVIDSVSKDRVGFHLQVDNGELPIKGIRAAYHTDNFTIDPKLPGLGFFEVATFMPRMLPARGTLSIPGKTTDVFEDVFARNKQTSLTVMIGYSAETSPTTRKDFTAIYRFLVRPEDLKPQVIHPEGIETKEQPFSDQAMQISLTAETFRRPKGTLTFTVDEIANGKPNIVYDQNEDRRFLFDPFAKLVTFQMKTSSRKLISLELPLLPKNDKTHKIVLGWDSSEGGYLGVDGIMIRNMKGKVRKFTFLEQ